ncbi:MAG TPA: DoxX family protein [Polyangiaceae bacterium]|nr:DoxX family protein [Polyangiaceae bacterium]
MTTSSTKLATASRLIQGSAFLVFGLNGFFHFLPMPAPPPAAGAFFGALLATGYMFPLIKTTEIVTAILLLSNRFVPLALALIAPVIVNIVAFHAFLAPAGLALPLVLLATELTLAWNYRKAYSPMLRARATPAPLTNSKDDVIREARATA